MSKIEKYKNKRKLINHNDPKINSTQINESPNKIDHGMII